MGICIFSWYNFEIEPNVQKQKHINQKSQIYCHHVPSWYVFLFLFEMMMKIMDWWHDILLLILHLQNITFIRCRLICSLYLHTICFGSMIREIGESTYGKCISAFNMKHVMRQSSDNAVSINNFYWIILCLVAIGVKT